MELIYTIVAFAVCFFVLIAVHEFGHFLAGWAGGVPARNMKIRLLVFPQRVLLRDGDRWVSPLDIGPYVTVMRRYLTTLPKCYLYVAGGLLSETLFSSATSVAFVELGWLTFAFLVAFSTLIHYIAYLVLLDLPMALWNGRASGDFSGLWSMAKIPTVMLVTGLFAVQALLLWYATR